MARRFWDLAYNAMLCRSTCENVMRVLRMNKDSVMAMLEAFVHDPLINWRLLNTAEADADNALSTANTGDSHMPGLSPLLLRGLQASIETPPRDAMMLFSVPLHLCNSSSLSCL